MMVVNIQEINIIMSAAATTASLFILLETWRRRHVRGAGWFAGLVAAISWVSFWYIFEALGGYDLDAYLTFSKLEYIGLAFIPLTWLGFSLTFANRERLLSKEVLIPLTIVPLITIVLAFANEWHGLIWNTARFEVGELGPVFTPQYGVWFWVYILYAYSLFAVGSAMLLLQSMKKWHLYRAQALLFLAGTTLPWISNLLDIFDQLNPIPELYFNAIFLTGAMIAFAFGLFRLRLLDVMPLPYDTILNHIPDGFIVTDTQDRVLAINKNVLPFLTVSRESVIGELLSEVFADFTSILTTLNMLPEMKHEWQVRDKVIEVRVTSIFDQRSIYRGKLYVLRDITERKRAEEALYASEAQYRSLVASLSEGVVLHEANGAIQATNAAAERILGLTTDQMMGRTSVDPHWRAIHEDGTPFPGETHPAMVTLRTGEAVSNVVMGVHKPDGELTWIIVNSQPIKRDGETHAVVASFTDITEHKEAEQRSVELAMEKERINILTHFIRDASHEFRTPLSIIHSSAYLLGKTDNRQIQEQKLHQIVEQAKRMTHLVEKLVEMSRLDSGIHFECGLVSMNIVVEKVLQRIQSTVLSKGRIFETALETLLPAVDGSVDLLFDALYHLVDNAVRHTSPDGCISLTTRHYENDIMIEVRDNGTGIAEEALPLIFNRFYRFDSAHSTPGLGLGLPIAQKVAQLHGGRIEVESSVNVGSVFRIVLPVSSEG